MIKSVTVTNQSDESIKLELRRPEKSGFLVQKIEGLGPVKALINTTDLATTDGGLFNSSRLGMRNIVLYLKLLEKNSIEDIRQLSYKYFPIRRRVRLLFELDNRTCYIYGYVEANEPDIFSDSETTQISIICPDPYFYSQGVQTTVFSGIEAVFEFEFSNESLDEDLLEFGEIFSQRTQTIYYQGDGDAGVVISIHALGAATNVTIYNVDMRETMRLDSSKLIELTGSDIVAGDHITISTVKGNKYIYLLREGVYTNILNCLDREADWFQLRKGDNVFTYTSEDGVLNLQFMVQNNIAYEGV